jgi:hypothetical protein
MTADRHTTMELVVERAAGLLSEGFLARQRGRKREIHFSIPTLSKRERLAPERLLSLDLQAGEPMVR